MLKYQYEVKEEDLPLQKIEAKISLIEGIGQYSKINEEIATMKRKQTAKEKMEHDRRRQLKLKE